MAVNPLEKSIGIANRTTRQLGVLFGRAGTLKHPRGHVLTAYRNGRLALRQVLKNGGSYADVLLGLRRAVQAEVFQLLIDAQELGKQLFMDQAAAYEVEYQAANVQVAATALQAVMGRVDQQVAAVQAMLATGTDEVLIFGDESRAGVLSPAPVLRDTAHWLSEVAALAFTGMASMPMTRQGRRVEFQKQAVAGLDENTTDCCLRVHGQVQPLDGKFELTGTPRFADRMEHTPFHWYCRTSIVLYLGEFDDGITGRMRAGADQIMNERDAGKSGNRHPADAFA